MASAFWWEHMANLRYWADLIHRVNLQSWHHTEPSTAKLEHYETAPLLLLMDGYNGMNLVCIMAEQRCHPLEKGFVLMLSIEALHKISREGAHLQLSDQEAILANDVQDLSFFVNGIRFDDGQCPETMVTLCSQYLNQRNHQSGVVRATKGTQTFLSALTNLFV